jgi:hypothetical protein
MSKMEKIGPLEAHFVLWPASPMWANGWRPSCISIVNGLATDSVVHFISSRIVVPRPQSMLQRSKRQPN